MPTIIVPRRWTRQPKGTVDIDLGNNLSDGIGALGLGHTLFDYVSRTQPTQVAASNIFYNSVGEEGLCRTGNTTLYVTSYSDIYGNTTFGRTVMPRTIFVLFSLNQLGAIQGIVGTEQETGSGLGIKINSSNQIRVGVNNSYVVGEALTTGKVYFAVGTADGATGKIYVNGKLSASGSLTSPGTGGDGFIVNGCWSSTSYANIFLWGGYTNVLSEGAVRELSKNYWQLFKPRREIFYFDTGSVTIPTLSSPGVTNILTTSATPQVTLTF